MNNRPAISEPPLWHPLCFYVDNEKTNTSLPTKTQLAVLFTEGKQRSHSEAHGWTSLRGNGWISFPDTDTTHKHLSGFVFSQTRISPSDQRLVEELMKHVPDLISQ